MQERRVPSLDREDPWRRKWQPTPVFLSRKAHGQRRLVGCSPWGQPRVEHDWATEHARRLRSTRVREGDRRAARRFLFFRDWLSNILRQGGATAACFLQKREYSARERRYTEELRSLDIRGRLSKFHGRPWRFLMTVPTISLRGPRQRTLPDRKGQRGRRAPASSSAGAGRSGGPKLRFGYLVFVMGVVLWVSTTAGTTPEGAPGGR